MEYAKQEVLRYLGHRGQGIPLQLDTMLEECMRLMRETAVPRHVRRAFGVRFEADGVYFENTGIVLPGSDIRRHLTGCNEVVLMAVTLGVPADNLIRRFENIDLTCSLILDACATQMVEQQCDEIEKQVCKEAQGSGLTARFSAGYGDLPLSVQPKLLSVLDASRRIGLTCTENDIMLPRKSVTAIWGLGKEKKNGGCHSCDLFESCEFARKSSVLRKDGEDGYKKTCP